MKQQQRATLRRTQGTVVQAKVQEAIRLLGLPSQEVVALVKTELAENPFLVEIESEHPTTYSEEEERKDSANETYQDAIEGLILTEGFDEDDHKIEVKSNLEADSESNAKDWGELVENRPESLFDKLHKQIALAGFCAEEYEIACQLIEHTDDFGFLRTEVEEISRLSNTSTDFVESVLKACQNLEPTGVMARNLSECFKLQLEEQGIYTPQIALVLDNLELVGQQDWEELKIQTGLEQDAIRSNINLLSGLSYKPYEPAWKDGETILKPDVIVEKRHDHTFSVELNDEVFPDILLDYEYISRIAEKGADTKDYIEKQTSRANWLIDALNRRAITTLRVATEIVRHQTPYLNHGLKEFKTLTARLIAERLVLHESTISRAIANKFIATPRGVFPFSFFLSRASISSSEEEGKSSQAVQERIKILINEEKSDSVLSDNDIANILKEDGFGISRRTIAKYRENLGIPSSSERRKSLKTKKTQ